MGEAGSLTRRVLVAQTHWAALDPEANRKEVGDRIGEGDTCKRHGRIAGSRCDPRKGDGHEQHHDIGGQPPRQEVGAAVALQREPGSECEERWGEEQAGDGEGHAAKVPRAAGVW